MDIKVSSIAFPGKRIALHEDGKEIGHTYLITCEFLEGQRSVAFIEDMFIEEWYRGGGRWTKLLEATIAAARELDCRKVIACSRYERTSVHSFYEKAGFYDRGKEFRLDLDE